MSRRTQQRGEGKTGCMLTLLVLGLLVAAGAKIVPVFYANNSLEDTAADLASKAGVLPVASIEVQLQDKAKELEIPEALAKGAMRVTLVGERVAGTCTIRLNYSRKIDLYGVYTLTVTTDKSVMKPYMDAR
jgi:hypothetical protein